MRIYSNDPSNGLMLVKILGNRYEPNGLVINYDEITDARYLDVLVSLNNYSGVTAIQADFSYPKEYYTTSNKNITLTERCSDFTKTAIAVNDSTFKVLIFSMNNELISGNEGNIFKIRLTRKEGADNQTATVSLKNIILSDVKGNDKNSSGNQMKSVNLMSNVSVNCNPSNSGAVTGTGSYHKGTEVILTATPNVGYRFVNWTENNIVVSSDIEYLFTITENRNLVANFELLTYDVTITMDIENAGVGTGEGNYSHGDNVTVNVAPNEGYKFVNWTENGEVVSGNNQENAAYPAGICAERCALFYANSAYPQIPVKVIAIAAQKEDGAYTEYPITPCGVCRQVMSEFCRGDFRVIWGNGEKVTDKALEEILPFGFSKSSL